ncbi:hypothetical protein JOC74_004785 [Bacillus capparidis]|uniref:Uncharacterized protein n=1 Tax=Bacillus capparidis TaxID=1840411 RepID=A0ABS4D3M3_9BACI|nr:hypothetical protein [Bacillus capparidis]
MNFPFENVSKLLSFRDKDLHIPSYGQFVSNYAVLILEEHATH